MKVNLAMNNSAFINILSSFSEAEFKEFDKFVHSPYFNTSKATAACFDVIKIKYPLFETGVEKENIFSAAYPGKAYDDVLMRRHISNLIKLTEEFLTLCMLKRKERVKKRYLLEELRLRKLNKYYERKMKQFEADFSQSALVDRDYFIDKYFYEHEKIYHYVSVNKQEKIPPNVIQRSNYLVYFFMQELVHNKHDININERQLNYKADDILVNSIYSNLNTADITASHGERPYETGVLRLYFNLSKMLWESDDSSGRKSKELLQSLMKSLDFDMKNLIFAMLESYCILKINYEKEETLKFNAELFGIYSLMLDENIFLYPDNNFKVAEFRNVLINSLQLKNSEWAVEFIKKYSPYLDKQIRADFVNYSYARVYNTQQRYESVLESLVKIRHENFLYQFDIKDMQAIAYYELEMYEQAFSLVGSYRKLLHNSGNLEERRRKNINSFINCYSKLIKIKAGDISPEEIYSLEAKVNAESLLNKQWLLKEINALKTVI